jgi:hypothetical protein
VKSTLVEASTGFVLTVKVVLPLPPGTITLAGTVATDALLLESATSKPSDGAALVNVTVPVELSPPTTRTGFNDSAQSEGGGGGVVTISEADCEIHPSVAVTPMMVLEVTGEVATVKLALV